MELIWTELGLIQGGPLDNPNDRWQKNTETLLTAVHYKHGHLGPGLSSLSETTSIDLIVKGYSHSCLKGVISERLYQSKLHPWAFSKVKANGIGVHCFPVSGAWLERPKKCPCSNWLLYPVSPGISYQRLTILNCSQISCGKSSMSIPACLKPLYELWSRKSLWE